MVSPLLASLVVHSQAFSLSVQRTERPDLRLYCATVSLHLAPGLSMEGTHDL